LSSRRPGLIYAAASGYGPDGPYADKPGQDLLAQALFGMMAITGSADAPRPAGASVIDHHGAALFAMGILAALVRRQRTGRGCRVDASLMQAALDLQAESLVAWSNAGARRRAIHAPRHVAGWYFAAPYGVYATADGHLAVSLSPLAALAEALPEPRLATYSEDASWVKQDEIGALIADHLARATNSAWIARMQPLGIWHAPVRGYAEILEDPQVAHMQALVSTAGRGDTGAPVTLVNHPVLYDGEAAEVRLAPQRLGAQTREVLAEIGFGDEEIAALARDQIIACAAD
jgi:crotonobetainyl-CoA:carnitine CoA-transferase CaiB-like acyl-CoA transferase